MSDHLSLDDRAGTASRKNSARPAPRPITMGMAGGRWAALLITLVLIQPHPDLLACTTGVISGKATVDGRPLLWKNRDAPHKNNQVVHLTDGQYAATAVVNAGQRRSVWMGVNEVGFCIENSVSPDMAEKGAKGLGNGTFMLRALQTCANVEEFERLLKSTDGSRATTANFGVIDAAGGAVIFETSPSAHRKFDANDPEVAPHGYVIRSNFSTLGSPEVDPGDSEQVAQIYAGGRYLRGCQLIDTALAGSGVSLSYLLRRTARDLAEGAFDPSQQPLETALDTLPDRLDTTSTISRRTSVSAAVFHGVKAGEDPRLTTMWVLLGEPAFTIAVPCWTATGTVAEALIGTETSPLCDAARALRDPFYIDKPNATKKDRPLLDTTVLPQIWAETLPAEQRHLKSVAAALKTWRTTGFDTDQATALHQRISDETLAQLRDLAARLIPAPAIAQ